MMLPGDLKSLKADRQRTEAPNGCCCGINGGMFTGQVAASFSHHSLVVVIECVSVSRFCSNGKTAGNLQRGKSYLSHIHILFESRPTVI